MSAKYPGTVGPAGQPAVSSAAVAGTGLAVTFSPGYGLAASGYTGIPPSSVSGQLTLTPQAPAVLPGLATQRYLTASNAERGLDRADLHRRRGRQREDRRGGERVPHRVRQRRRAHR